MIFLIVFSRKTGLQSVTEFADSAVSEANIARAQTIRENLARLSDLEIALFQAESLATLKVTHRRYFESIQDLFESMGKKPA